MKDSYSDHTVKKDARHQLRGHPIISDQISRETLEVVCRQLESTLQKNVPGAVVELGCYIGTTSLFIRRILDARGESASREFHAYDSFEGLPEKGQQDSNAAGIDFEAGKLYVSKKEFLQQFRAAGLAAPITHKGWFDELQPADMPEQIAFAFLDGDFYESIISSLRLVWPRMSDGGQIIIDDYKRETLPGVERAIRDFTQTKSVTIREEQNLAILTLTANSAGKENQR
jgi:O-methyltransferase